MSNFGLDNAGSGFNLDDDEDFESMLGRASAASEDDGDLDFNRRETVQQKPAYSLPEEPAEDTAEAEEAPAEEPTVAEPLVDLPSFDVEPDPVAEEPAAQEESWDEPAPVTQPAEEVQPYFEKPAAPAPAEEPAFVAPPAPTSPVPSKTRVRVPSQEEQVAEAQRILRVADVYRKLTAEEKSVAVQFVTDGEMDSADDAVLVVRAINADSMLTATMRALREAYECDAVERAFYAMALDTKTLHNMGSLVTVFTDEEYDETLPNLQYSRVVVAAVAQLNDHQINLVKATESVLAAAEMPGD